MARAGGGHFFTRVNNWLNRNRLGELLVTHGKIQPQDLKNALQSQKTHKRALGQILVEQGFITKARLYRYLFQQTAMRYLVAVFALTVTFSAGLSSAKAQNTRPDGLMQVSAPAAATTASKTSYKRNVAVFGSQEIRYNNITTFSKWTSALKRHARGMRNVRWKQDLNISAHSNFEQKIQAVNSYVNRVQYREDRDVWNQSDYWASPAEFFALGGDCEDYAFAKYAILRELGIPRDAMRLAIVQDTVINQKHAVLIVYGNGTAYVLDNQARRAQPVHSVNRYRPIFSINETAWWHHKTAS